ncbi:sigma-70 family RNA polymerase sigma factor [Sutcliffiella rhizosphaerae]|uniref:RNA polymerase sigma factor n=1 Tax=Sutcliffiella rhizosphaerae TaxID=2880967 RepID=A0ABM8YNB5_9BACI|nr:sigma-70 family RNA polymerase sigma factor [Sutcliffiella rhizosphaerae]CAG9621471.1 hypothetical protein BACCIP111883_02244 [Sutcliffiella rhizosphaerae]
MDRRNTLSDEKREELVISAMNQHGEEIKRLIFTYVRNYSVVDDLSQEVFVKVYKNLHLFRGESTMKTWIYRIAINICKDYLSSFKYKVQQLVNPILVSKEQPEEKALASEENRELAQLVMALPLKYREVLILHYYRDFSIEEISELLSLKQNTVKTHLRRGREKIKGILAKGGLDYEQESRKGSL